MGRPMLDKSSPTTRLHIAITEAEIAAVNECRWENRISSLSEAVRLLLKAGIAADEGRL